MILRNSEFSDCVEKFLALSKMPISTFGRQANNDSRFVYDLRKGRSYSEQIKDRVLSFMQQYVADKGLEFDFNAWSGEV